MLIDRSLNRTLEASGDGEDPTLEDNTNAPADTEPEAVVDLVRVAELAFKEERRAHYGKREKTGNSSRKGKSRADLEVGSPMDDFINAHVCITCRRIVPEVYFGNDRTREFINRFDRETRLLT